MSPKSFNQRSRLVADGLILCAISVLSACTSVAPWERGNLAKKEMSVTPHPRLTILRDHIFTSKEASQGGYNNTGGGCGCN